MASAIACRAAVISFLIRDRTGPSTFASTADSKSHKVTRVRLARTPAYLAARTADLLLAAGTNAGAAANIASKATLPSRLLSEIGFSSKYPASPSQPPKRSLYDKTRLPQFEVANDHKPGAGHCALHGYSRADLLGSDVRRRIRLRCGHDLFLKHLAMSSTISVARA